MVRTIERKRPSMKAEFYVAESVMNKVADFGDVAYETETEVSGLISGTLYHDLQGVYGEALDLVTGTEDTGGIIGWFRTSSDGCSMTDKDVAYHRSLFGDDKAFALMIAPSMSSLAMYTVENGVARKVSAMIIENR